MSLACAAGTRLRTVCHVEWKTVEGLEKAAGKEGNHTLAADDIDWCGSQIDCFCQWHVVN